MPTGRKVIRVDGLTPKDKREIEREAERRGMYRTRLRVLALRKGLEVLRTEAQNPE